MKQLAHLGSGFEKLNRERMLSSDSFYKPPSNVKFVDFLWPSGLIIIISYAIILFGTVLCIRYIIKEIKTILKIDKKLKLIILAVISLFFLWTSSLIWSRFIKTYSGDKIYVTVGEPGEIVTLETVNHEIVSRIKLNKKNGQTETETMVHQMSMPAMYMPHNVQVSPDNKSVWATVNEMSMSMGKNTMSLSASTSQNTMSMGDDEIIVIDPLRDKIIKRIKLSSNLHLSHISLTPDSAYAIAVSQQKGIIYKINAKTYEVEKTTQTKESDQPHGVRISPDGKTAYIAIFEGKSLGVLDIESFNLSYIPLKGAAVQSGVTLDGKYALASVYDAKSLAVYDIAAKKLSYVDLPTEAKGPVQIYPSPDSKYVYVADQGYYLDQPGNNLVYKIDLEKMKVANSIKVAEAPHGVVVSRDGKFIYITTLSGYLSVIDIPAGKEVDRIPVGNMPNGVSVFYAK